MSSKKVMWCKKRKQYIPGRPKLNIDGLPVDVHDWTEADWQDLHECLENIKRRIAARHRDGEQNASA